jgi:CTP:molybdopterin cytidylyltransferase MocA
VIAAVVLAAGAATRFGSPKQRILLEPVLERVRSSSVDRVVVVVGAYELETRARTVHCPEWERGPGASLRCGLEALPSETEAAIVILADGPDLAPQAIDRVVAAWRESGQDVVAATYGGERSHPVLLARGVWHRVPDEGARSLAAFAVACDDLGPPGDVDYPADLPGRFKGRGAELHRVDEDEHRGSAPPDSTAASAELAADGRPPARRRA